MNKKFNLPLDIQVLNTINSWSGKGFFNFRLFEDGDIFGIKFNSKNEERCCALRCDDRKHRKEYIKAIKEILNLPHVMKLHAPQQ